MDSPDATFENIKMFLDLLKHCSAHLSQQVNSRLEEPPHPAMSRNIDIRSDHNGPPNSIANVKGSSTTYHIARVGPLSIPNTHFPCIPPPPTDVKGVQLIPIWVSDSPALIQVPGATSLRSLSPGSVGIQIKVAILTLLAVFESCWI